MINIKTSEQIEEMAEGGKILAAILHALEAATKPGVATKDLNTIARDMTLAAKAKPAFLGYQVGRNRFPAALCVSVNDEVVHGIPGDRVLQDGDIVGLDMGVIYKGWNLDAAVTVLVTDGKLPGRCSSV